MERNNQFFNQYSCKRCNFLNLFDGFYLFYYALHVFAPHLNPSGINLHPIMLLVNFCRRLKKSRVNIHIMIHMKYYQLFLGMAKILDKIYGKQSKIKQNWIRQENLDICFSPSFYRYYQ